jgi:hypothetical protein
MEIKGTFFGILVKNSEKCSIVHIFNVLKKKKISVFDSVSFKSLSIYPLPDNEEALLLGLYSSLGNLSIYEILFDSGSGNISKIFSFIDKKFPVTNFFWSPHKRLC